MSEYELVIIGGGPAAAAAGVYAARKQLRTRLIAEDFGGQSIVSPKIENWIGTPAISGEELARNLQAHLEANAGDYLTIASGLRGEKVVASGGGFEVAQSDGVKISTQTVLLATGASRRQLNVPGAKQLEHKGLTYCASCDGPLFADQEVVVIGGGNAGFETALQLLAYCQKVTLLHHGENLKADPVTVEAAKKNPKMNIILNAETLEIKGEKFVDGLTYRDKKSGEEKTLTAGGIFVEIGLVPNTKPVEGLADLNPYGAVIVDPKNQRASRAGLWAAGDCAAGLYHQNNIAAGDAVKALEDIYLYLRRGN